MLLPTKLRTSSPRSGALGVAPSGGRPMKPTRSASSGMSGPVVAGVATGSRSARAPSTIAAIAITATSTSTPIRCDRGGGSGWGGLGPIFRARAITSGTSSASSAPKRSRRSVIGVLQLRPQAPSGLREVDAHGRLAAPEDPCHLTRGKVGVQAQDRGRALVRAEGAERAYEVHDRLGKVDGRFGIDAERGPPALLQLAGNAARQTQRSGDSIAEPRPSACANASADRKST